eukprot:gene6427-3055_t
MLASQQAHNRLLRPISALPHAATIRTSFSSPTVSTTGYSLAPSVSCSTASETRIPLAAHVGAFRRSVRLNASSKEVFSSFESVGDSQFVVVNFYHLVDVEDPEQVVADHKAWIENNKLDVRGRIYFSKQGVNAQFGGTFADSQAYTTYIKSLHSFQDLRYSVWPASEQMFPKLRMKFKPNLISLSGGMECLPVTDPSNRATPLEPEDWKKMIKRKVVVLDVRNDYEWDAGHFVGAERPQEEEFAETPVGLDSNDVPSYLNEADPDTPVMMYCTGGIRCDVYSAFLRKKGFNNLYTLEGGVQNYLLKSGPEHWNGSLYVFDGRMAIPPTIGTLVEKGAEAIQQEPLPCAAPCQVCDSPDSQLPHMNCANMDCNELFIACAGCKSRFRGCCCEECMSAPRLLRPVKLDGGHYGAWGNYSDDESAGMRIASGRKREGRVARMAKRRGMMKDRRTQKHEAEIEIKKQIREATAKLLAPSSQATEPLSEKQRKIQELRAKLQRKGSEAVSHS